MGELADEATSVVAGRVFENDRLNTFTESWLAAQHAVRALARIAERFVAVGGAVQHVCDQLGADVQAVCTTLAPLLRDARGHADTAAPVGGLTFEAPWFACLAHTLLSWIALRVLACTPAGTRERATAPRRLTRVRTRQMRSIPWMISSA